MTGPFAAERRTAARASARMNFRQPDAAPTDRLNKILWADARGYGTPYPGVRQAAFFPPSVDLADDEREEVEEAERKKAARVEEPVRRSDSQVPPDPPVVERPVRRDATQRRRRPPPHLRLVPVGRREPQASGDEQAEPVPARGAEEPFVLFFGGRHQHRHLRVRRAVPSAQRDEHLFQPARIALALARRGLWTQGFGSWIVAILAQGEVE